MKKCPRVKNPCKICMKSVCPKKGIQCKGVCKRWAHFSCLKYTPGTIEDIEAGIITVTCPCPSCKTAEPREFISYQPFLCENDGCDAYLVPNCENPSHSDSDCCPKVPCAEPAFPPPVTIPSEPKIPPCPQKRPNCMKPKGSCNQTVDNEPKSNNPAHKRFDTCRTDKKPNLVKKVKTDTEKTCCHEKSVEECNSESPKCCQPERKGRNLDADGGCLSCSCISTRLHIPDLNEEDCTPLKSPKSCSESALLNDSEINILHTLQQLCTTVGHLSNQVKKLICKMLTDMNKN